MAAGFASRAFGWLGRQWSARPWRTAAAAFVLLLLLLVAAIHSPPARATVLSLAASWARDNASLEVEAERLDYNLFTLRAGLRGLKVGVLGSATPFFESEAIRVDLPWSLVGGPLAVQSLEVERPRVRIVREADGGLNVPEAAAEPEAAPAPEAAAVPQPVGPVTIDRLLIRDLALQYGDSSQELSVDGRGVTLDLRATPDSPLAGRLSMTDGIDLRMGQRSTAVSKLESGLGFDGSTLTLDAFVLEAPEVRARIDGSIDLLTGQQRLDLQYDARLDTGRLAPWLAIDPAPSGLVAVAGTAAGPLDDPRVTAAVSGERLVWPSVGTLAVQARAALAGSTATVESFRVRLGRGALEGHARVQLGDEGESTVKARWRDLDAGALADSLADLPLRLATIVDGSADLTWAGQQLMAARGTVAARLRSSTGASAEVMPLEGRLDLRLSDGRYALTLDQRAAETVALTVNASGRLNTDEPASSTVTGEASLAVESLNLAAGRLRAAGLEAVPEAVADLRGAIEAAATLEGTWGAPRAIGTLRAGSVRLGDLGPADATASFTADRTRVLVDALRLELGANVVTGHADTGLEANTLAGRLNADLRNVSQLAAMVPAEWRPEGAGRLAVQLGGALDNPSVDASLDAGRIAVAGQAVSGVEARLRLADGVVFVDELEVSQPRGRLNATARYTLESGQYAFDVAADGLAIVPVEPAAAPGDPETKDPVAGPAAAEGEPAPAGAEAIPVDATFDLRLVGEGTVAEPQARGFVEFSRLDYGSYQLGTTRADVTVEAGKARVVASLPSLDASLDATVALESPRTFTAALSMRDANVTDLTRSTGPAGPVVADETPIIDPEVVAGALRLRANASGSLDDPEGATVDLDLRLVDVSVNGAALRLERPARVRYANREVVADDLELHIGSSTLTANGRLAVSPGGAERLQVALTGSLADFVPFARLAPALENVDLSGAIDLRMRAAGSVEAPDISGELTLSDASLSDGTLPPVEGLAVGATFAGGLLELDQLRASWQGATVTGEGAVPVTLFTDALPDGYRSTLPALPDRGRGTLRLDGITPEALAPFLDRATVDEMAGRLDVRVAFEAVSLDLERATADVTFDRAELELARVPLAQTGPTRLRLADGRLAIDRWIWAGAGNRLELSGGVLLSGEAPELDVAASGDIDLRMIAAFTRDVATSGKARLEVKATGPAATPRVDGQVSVADADIIIREPRLAITELTGRVALTEGGLRLDEMTASANGGTLKISGEVQYPDFELAGGTIVVTGRGLAFEIPEHLRTEVDADLTLDVNPDAPSLTGRVTVLRGSYRKPISLTGQLLAGANVQTTVPDDAEPTLLDRVQLGVSVVSDEDILLDNNYGRLELGSNLKVIGTPGQPALAGRLTVREGGEVYLSGQTYEVQRGTVDFTSATRIEPNIDLALETRVQNYDITLEVTGTPETLEAELRSPGVSQEDVVSLLLTGRLADDASVAQTEIARGQLLMLLSGELLGFAGRAVGLDSVQVSRGLGGSASDFDLLATDTDPSARLTLSKSLSRQVEVVFSQGLRESGDITWIALYRPFRSIELRGTTQDDDSRSYEFRHELNFGGGMMPGAARSSRARAQGERITEVRITGTPGFDEREVRDRLRLKEGNRFAYYRWQQDRDRLDALYHDRGFLEARIIARRRTPEAGALGGLVLEYDIERGPEARLTVEGHELSSGLVNRMRETWSRAEFDGFLLEDLAVLARRGLAEQRYLQATVETRVASPPDGAVKEIVVRIDPGRRFEQVSLAFNGHERLSSEVLEGVVRARGLELTAWLEPDEVETALEQYYRSLGNLSAEVTVEPPVFEGQSATLPIRVAEGRQFQIAAVEVKGARAKTEVELRERFGIEAGGAYLPGALERARREVEVAYLRDGFNSARVSVATLVDPDLARVDIVLSVNEGRQQVLRTVEVSGAARTASSVIDRALDLEPGQPANLTDYYRAQKRLYDTGVFQSADVEIEPIEEGDGEGPQAVKATVTLRELPLYRFRYGFRLTDEVGPTEPTREVRPAFVADVLRRNLFGRAITTGVAGQIEGDRRLGRGILSFPSLLSLPVTSSLFLTASRQDFNPEGATPFIEDLTEITAEQRFRPTRRMAVSYSYSYGRSHVFSTKPIPGSLPLDFTANVARLTGTYAWDTRDDPANARRGWFHSSGLEYGAEALGSDLRFIRYLSQQYYFKTVREGVVLASAFRAGAGRGFGQDLISSEKFFVGGGTSVRGFAEDGIGDVDFLGDPTGGNALVLFNQEVRFPIYGWVRGVGFLDAGNVFTRAGDFSLGDLEAGTGFGLRIDSPFALVRIDYGIPLTDRRRQPFGRWYFGIGHTF
jgi:outer membrane protein assembly complex protein YaeT